MCWNCGAPAKGQKHFKESPECYSDEGTILPFSVTDEMIQKYLGLAQDPCINVKYCAFCPKCMHINPKRGTLNMLVCAQCKESYCYICNKTIPGEEHYNGKSQCQLHTEPWNDL